MNVYFLWKHIFYPSYLSFNLPELSQQTLNQHLISHMHLLIAQISPLSFLSPYFLLIFYAVWNVSCSPLGSGLMQRCVGLGRSLHSKGSRRKTDNPQKRLIGWQWRKKPGDSKNFDQHSVKTDSCDLIARVQSETSTPVLFVKKQQEFKLQRRSKESTNFPPH